MTVDQWIGAGLLVSVCVSEARARVSNTLLSERDAGIRGENTASREAWREHQAPAARSESSVAHKAGAGLAGTDGSAVPPASASTPPRESTLGGPSFPLVGGPPLSHTETR